MIKSQYQILLVWGSAIIGAGIAFITQAYLGRAFHPVEFGDFNFALVFAGLAAMFGFQGIGDITLRMRGNVKVQTLVISALVLTLFGVTCLSLVLLFIPRSANNPALLIAFLPYVIAQGGMFIGMAYWQLRDSPVGISAF